MCYYIVMKQFLTKLSVFIMIIFSVFSVTSLLNPTPTYADCRNFLGLNSWDCGINDINSADDIKDNAITIASNIFIDITVVAAYLVLGYVIYGGYLYMFASGDSSKVSAGKKTLSHAFIGLAVVMLSNIILNTIRIALLGAGGKFGDCVADNCVDANQLVTNAIQWVIGVAGIVALIYVVIGGIGYITASGDSSKLQKSKQTILYALIGLVIVALAEIITAFVSNLIRTNG